VNASNARYRNSPQAGIDAQAQAAQQQRLKKTEFNAMPLPLRFGIGMGESVARGGRGVRQLYAMAQDAIDPRSQNIAGLIAGQPSRLDEAKQAEAQARANDQYMEGDAAASAGKFTGDVAQVVALPVGRSASLLGRLGTNAALGAGIGALQPVTQDESRTANTVVGGLLGGVGQGAGEVLGKVAQGAPKAARDLYALGKAHGIDLLPAQVTESPFVRSVSSALNKLPFSGGMAAMKRQQTGFNRAVGKTFGVDAPVLSDDVMADVARRHGAAYDDLFARNNITLDDAALNRLSAIEQEAANVPEHAAAVKKQVADVLDMAKDGSIPGADYQAFRVDRLKRLEDSYRNSQPFLSGLYRNLRQTLEGAAERSFGGEDAAALKALNRQYANRKAAEKALAQVEGLKGNVRPASLGPIVNRKGGSTTEMRELARLGQGLKDTVPDSGTAQRLLAYKMLGLAGGGYAATHSENPYIKDAGLLLLGGTLGGRAINSRKLAGLLARDGGGQAAKLAPMLPYTGLLGPMVLQDGGY